MKVSHWLFPGIALFLLAISPAIFAQTLCFRTCAPDPTSPTYPANTAAQFAPRNGRGRGSLTNPAQKTGNSNRVLGSSSYSYALPVLHLPGRAGLDLDLNLYYNSDVWTFNASNTSVTFNADRDWPSYGFRLDFGLLISSSGSYFLIEADGTKHVLASSGSGVYESTDSTYINLALGSPDSTLTYKNGRQVIYERFPSTQSLLRPVRINDTNGNYIAISYVSGTDQQINTITDSLGRVVQFNYNPTTGASQQHHVEQWRAHLGHVLMESLLFAWLQLQRQRSGQSGQGGYAQRAHRRDIAQQHANHVYLWLLGHRHADLQSQQQRSNSQLPDLRFSWNCWAPFRPAHLHAADRIRRFYRKLPHMELLHPDKQQSRKPDHHHGSRRDLHGRQSLYGCQ